MTVYNEFNPFTKKLDKVADTDILDLIYSQPGLIILVTPTSDNIAFNPSADTDAARGDALNSAVAIAVSGDCLMVGPGTFDTGASNFLKSGVNYHLAPGCTINANDGDFFGQPLDSGVYTPTRSSETNLDSNVTMTEAQYLRVGKTVTVSGRFTADPTAAGATNFEITLPVASNLGAAEDLAGVAVCGAIAGQCATIHGVVANDTAEIAWIAVDTTSQVWSYTFTYQVI